MNKNEIEGSVERVAKMKEEIEHYEQYFKEKNILVNCGNPEETDLFLAIYPSVSRLKVKKITFVFRNDEEEEEKDYILEMFGDRCRESRKIPLKSKDDFEDENIMKLLKECDMVMISPSVDLFKEHLNLYRKLKKTYIVVDNSKDSKTAVQTVYYTKTKRDN